MLIMASEEENEENFQGTLKGVMTNSIASAKCPSILTSGKYGMSQRRSVSDDSKEYIFVKLTDSAFRAIEEYQRNVQSKHFQKGQCAKIQFIGNGGVIQFPPTVEGSIGKGGQSDGRNFGFAIDDVEGSLECIQQSGTDLDVLGSLSYRMRIHANDDVYDTTRTKMAIAEETEKSKCIREIKPNQTDIGRKVKRPVSAASIQAYTNGTTTPSLLNGLSNGNGSVNGSSNSISNNGSSSYLSNCNTNHNNNNSSNSRNKLPASSFSQQSPPCGGNSGTANGSRLMSNTSLRSSPNPSLLGGSGTIGINRYGSPSNLPTSSPNVANGGGSYSPPSSSNNHMAGSQNSQQKKGNTINGVNSRGGKSANGKVNGVLNGKALDVSRRKIRERLIHLLALKPFKKPELYSRLQNEGLAQRERQLISTILKDISTLSRDNTYNLRRSIWNDVDENWPFFSEQEIQQLKRRKPQNLTPPTSSDAGSSMSGHSPTSSTHTGSPPPLVVSSNLNPIGGGSGIKRTSLEPDFYDGISTLGMQSKKQRISHYKKDGSSSNSNNLVNINMNAGARISLGTGSNSNSSSYNQNNRSGSAYSPHTYNTGNNNGHDESSGNTDISFNVLNNMDDFIQHTAVVCGDSSYPARSKTSSDTTKIPTSFSSTSSGNNNASNSCNNATIQPALKEKRNSGGSNSSSGYGSNRESLSTSAFRRKNSPTPYANNFVPETKISSNSNVNSNSSRLNKQQQVQRQQQQLSPNYNNHSINHNESKTSNNSSISVMPNSHDDYSQSFAPPISQTTTTNQNSNQCSSRSQHHSVSLGNTSGRNACESSSSKHTKSLIPSQKNISKHLSNNIPQQEDQQSLFNESFRPTQIASHSSHPTQQDEHSSPTQQIAAAASTFSLTNHSTSTGGGIRHDFRNYTPITSIEQRRRYKTEFESDYDEYRKLLTQIESVGDRFRELATRLRSAEHGCADYYSIKDEIRYEYSRILEEETISRDKERFDYLHEKLAHIKQLVMEYDKKLTSGLASPSGVSNQQQTHKPESPNQQQQILITNNSAHLSPMLQSSGESNHSPPNTIIAGHEQNSLNSALHSKRSSKHYQKNHQPHNQEQEQFKQHHEPETIPLVYNNQEGDDLDPSMQYQFPYSCYEAGDKRINPQNVTSENLIQSDNGKQQQLEPQTQKPQNNNNDSDSDTDSTSSSSSNDNDNSDDDNSEVSDDDNSDDDSNYDDKDDQ